MASTSPIPSLLPKIAPTRANLAAVARASPAAKLQPASGAVSSRRQLLFLVVPAVAATMAKKPAFAVDVPLFGLRKKIEKVEEEVAKEAVELVKEGEAVVEKGIETAEKGIETVERGFVTAPGSGVGEGGLFQAGVVLGTEVVGVVIASSVVNGILGPEAQKP